MNGYAAHANASSTASLRPPNRSPIEDEREHREQVERDRRRVRCRQRVPLPAPREERDRRHVGEVGHRAVRVAALDPRLAAPVRLDALAHLSLGVLRPARLEVAALRHVPVRRLAVEDPARADDTGEPDVDHAARRFEVEPDAEPEEEDGRGRKHPGRPDGRERLAAPAEPDPQPAREQVRENGVDERDAPEDLSAVEEGERGREPEERDEVEVSDRERPAQVGEPDQEDEAEGEPDVPAKERLPAERAFAASRHLPRDLRPRPCLRHAPGRVLDRRLRDLPGLARPRLDEPRPRLGSKVRVRRRIGRVPLEPGLDLGMRERDLDRLVLGEPREIVLPGGGRGKSEREGRERGERN